MRIYTKTGDAGETGLLGGARVSKDHPRIEACGSVDELNAAVGLARCHRPCAAIDQALERVQRDLFHLGADLANGRADHATPSRIGEHHVARVEAAIDHCEAMLSPLKQFILPGGSPLAGHLHLARAVCRRAERLVVALARSERVDATLIVYLNRLSDLLFVLARAANLDAGVADVVWTAEPIRETSTDDVHLLD